MIDFFIALFGGGYWAIKKAKDSYKKIENDYRSIPEPYKRYIRSYVKGWSDMVVDKEEEEKLKNYIWGLNEEEWEKLRTETLKLYPDKIYSDDRYVSQDIILRILLSQKGKMYSEDVYKGMRCRGDCRYIPEKVESNKRWGRFVLWLTEQVEQRTGVKVDVYIHSSEEYERIYRQSIGYRGRCVHPLTEDSLYADAGAYKWNLSFEHVCDLPTEEYWKSYYGRH